ncbi:MAG: YhcN/YlaJ family sporulation lipoprotein [Clostridiales bacterium]|nr:YhcN/YlaJ family sporulation lipoprotein [Clostridiales bacterium]
MKVIATIILLAMITGCASGKEYARDNAEAFYKNGSTNTYRRGGNYQAEPTPAVQAAEEPKSDHAQILADAICELEGITKSSVILIGNTAIVGIRTEDLSSFDLQELKLAIANCVKALDENIDHVSVTDSHELSERISQMHGAGYDSDVINDFAPRS